jgi:hypothetical protein
LLATLCPHPSRSFVTNSKCGSAKLSAVAFAIHEKNELSVLKIQIEQLFVLGITEQRIIDGVYMFVLKGPTFAWLSLADFQRVPLGYALKQN